MSRSIAGKIKLNSFADIVGGDDTAVTEVPLSDLHEFKNHPFRVLDDEKMEETVESIRKNCVLMPGIVRPRLDGGGYEIIAGHRRKRACELAGLATMPVLIKNYTDDEATVTMVDTNIQREDILPSEKAHAYRMKFDAMKHQGSGGGRTVESIGEAAGESGKTVQRYIWLSNLSDTLLGFVDEKKLPIRSGVEISYLTDKEQGWIEEIVGSTGVVITPAQAEKIKGYSQSKELTKALLNEILAEEKPKPRKITFKGEKLSKYFPEDMPVEEIEEKIKYFKKLYGPSSSFRICLQALHYTQFQRTVELNNMISYYLRSLKNFRHILSDLNEDEFEKILKSINSISQNENEFSQQKLLFIKLYKNIELAKANILQRKSIQ